MNFRRFPKFPLVIVLLLLGASPAWAWGPQGHEIIAAIALRELTPAARSHVGRLLGSPVMMVHDSNWADEVRDRRRETGPWLYVDIPLKAGGYQPRRDCPQRDCVVAQIEKDARLLSDRGLSDGARAEALRFLIHFVGDAHQPLHAQDNGDRGGNDVPVRMGRRRISLHRLWDSDVVAALGRDGERVADDIAGSISPAQRRAWSSGTAGQWAAEAHAIARDRIYPELEERQEVRLPRDYALRQVPATRQQLAKAGVRLAWLLNTSLK